MAHTRKELALGSIGCIGLFLESLNLLFRFFALGNVSPGGIDQSLFWEGRRVPLHPSVRAILGAIPVFEGSRIVACDQSPKLGTRRVPVVGMYKFKERRGSQFVDAVPQHVLPRAVQSLEVAVISRDAQHCRSIG